MNQYWDFCYSVGAHGPGHSMVSMGKEVREIGKSHLAHSRSVVVLHAQLNVKKRFNVHSLELLNLAKL